MLIEQIVHILLSIYIFLLVLRLFVSARDAYFNPFYMSVFKATEPILAPFRKLQRSPRDMDRPDLLVLVLIALIVLIDGALLGFFNEQLGLREGIVIRLMGFVDYLFLFLVVIILIFSVFYRFYRYPANPFIRTAFKIVEPAYIAVGRGGEFLREYAGTALFVVALFLHMALSFFLLGFSSGNFLSVNFLSAIGVKLTVQHSLLTLLSLATFFTYVIIASALISWVSPDPANPIVQLLRLLSEPINRPFRKIIPLIGGIDISPIFSILVLQFIAQFGRQVVLRIFSPPPTVIFPV